MSNNFKESIEKMKVVVLDLMRSAANLDEIIQQLEYHEGSMNNVEIKYYLNALCSNREDFKQHKFCGDIDDRENEIWQELIAQFKEES